MLQQIPPALSAFSSAVTSQVFRYLYAIKFPHKGFKMHICMRPNSSAFFHLTGVKRSAPKDPS